MNMQDIIIGSDHRGFELKAKIKKYLLDKKLFCIDVGVASADRPSDHAPVPPIINVVKEAVECVKGSPHFCGIMICGSGVGMSIACNRYNGIRAALCHNTEDAKHARLHNDANILILAGEGHDFEHAQKIINTFLSTRFGADVPRYRLRREMFDKLVPQ